MANAVVIYGPQGCGKTTNAEKLAKHYGKAHVIELDDVPSVRGALPQDALVLTNDRALADRHAAASAGRVAVIGYVDAMEAMRKATEIDQ